MSETETVTHRQWENHAKRIEKKKLRETLIELRACPACLAEIEASLKKKPGRS